MNDSKTKGFSKLKVKTKTNEESAIAHTLNLSNLDTIISDEETKPSKKQNSLKIEYKKLAEFDQKLMKKCLEDSLINSEHV